MKRQDCQWLLLFALSACAVEVEPSAQSAAEAKSDQKLEVPDEDLLHAVVELSFAEDGALLRSARLGSGPAPGFGADGKPVLIALVDREGKRFDQFGIDDPRLLRLYNLAGEKVRPDSNERVASADTWVSVPVDGRLEALRISEPESGLEVELNLSEALYKSCELEPSVACERWLKAR